MTKETALQMLREYCEVIRTGVVSDTVTIYPVHASPEVADAAGMAERFPPDGSEKKAMRWLGYMQGVLVSNQYYTLDEVKEHSRFGRVRSFASGAQ